MSVGPVRSSHPVGQLVDLLRPRITGWKRIVARGDWALACPARRGLAFGIVTGGRCELRLPGREPVELRTGDYLLLADPPAWALGIGEAAAVGIEDLPLGFPAAFALGPADAPETARLFGGWAEVDPATADVAATAVAPVTVLPALAASRLAKLIDLLDGETAAGDPDRSPLLGRLLEAVLIEALQVGAACRHDAGGGLLAGLADPRLRAALRVIHADPGRRWTVAALAGAVGMSRSSFAERFTRVVGRAPIVYLADWRMALARRALAEGARVAEAARIAGYGSSSSFGAAFRREDGGSPTRARRRVGT